MNDKNFITGTQLIVNNRNIYQLLNLDEEIDSTRENPLFEKLGYKIFRDKFNSTYNAIMVYVTLSD